MRQCGDSNHPLIPATVKKTVVRTNGKRTLNQEFRKATSQEMSPRRFGLMKGMTP